MIFKGEEMLSWICWINYLVQKTMEKNAQRKRCRRMKKLAIGRFNEQENSMKRWRIAYHHSLTSWYKIWERHIDGPMMALKIPTSQWNMGETFFIERLNQQVRQQLLVLCMITPLMCSITQKFTARQQTEKASATHAQKQT